MKRFGRIISVEDGEARILVQKHSVCKNCGKCHDTSKEVKLDNSVEAEPGDVVALELEGSSLSTAAVIIYLVPVISLIAGYLLGVYLGFTQEWLRILTGGVCFGFSFWLARQMGKVRVENYEIEITKIINK